MRAATLAALLWCSVLGAQAPLRVTLQEAEQRAVANHPRIGSAGLTAQAASAVVKQVRSAFQPQLTGNITSVGADRNTAIAAGTLQTSGLVSRAATGVGVSQLITDFGRTSKLAEAARIRAEAQGQNVSATRAQALLQVHQTYYAALAADAVLGVARERLEMLRLTLRQVRALAASSLKSTLDVSFAEVAVSESELVLYQAENAAKASRANLAAAMGDPDHTELSIVDVQLPDRLSGDVETAVGDALRNRPDLGVLNLNQSAAQRLAEAEKKLRYPALTAVAVVGTVPVHQTNFSDSYSAAGVNIALPILNGGLNSARRAEAELRARASAKDVQSLALQIGAAVRVAWIDADTAWRRLDVTARLAQQAATTLRLAKARYEIGLSGILELTQAQVALTSAQTASASAKYDYLSRLAQLNYATGAFR